LRAFMAAILVLGVWITSIDGSTSINARNRKTIFLDSLNKPGINMKSAIYVLGGSQKSLERRFKKAASLYRTGAFGTIFTLGRLGKTEYSHALSRNLTNDEWTIQTLEAMGVKVEHIEVVPVFESIWGTYSEAAVMSDLVRERGYNRLVLITSPYHGERAWNTFYSFLESRNIRMEIYLADDSTGEKGLLIEFIKLLVYKKILIPLSHLPKFSLLQRSAIILTSLA
jgi:uncharacterized SAM-binding protein YcdF (DUF218 family)